jgi:hypothetical protein
MRANPILNLRAAGKIFQVKKTVLCEKLRLFQADPSLLNSAEYEVRSRVPGPIVEAFVKIIEGGDASISEENCESFRLLSEEFGFEALMQECAAFRALHHSRCESITETVIAGLAKRVGRLEEQSLYLKRESAMSAEAIRPLSARIAFLETEVRGLSGVCEKADAVPALEREMYRLSDVDVKLDRIAFLETEVRRLSGVYASEKAHEQRFVELENGFSRLSRRIETVLPPLDSLRESVIAIDKVISDAKVGTLKTMTESLRSELDLLGGAIGLSQDAISALIPTVRQVMYDRLGRCESGDSLISKDLEALDEIEWDMPDFRIERKPRPQKVGSM